MHGLAHKITVETDDPWAWIGTTAELHATDYAVLGITLHLAAEDFALSLALEGGETFKLRMSADQLGKLGRLLVQLAQQRELRGDV